MSVLSSIKKETLDKVQNENTVAYHIIYLKIPVSRTRNAYEISAFFQEKKRPLHIHEHNIISYFMDEF
mgnify:CR=1 FL=1